MTAILDALTEQVHDPQVAADLLSSYTGPKTLKLRAKLPADLVLPLLKKRALVAASAVAACQDPAVCAKAARHRSAAVRIAVAENEVTPLEVIVELWKDAVSRGQATLASALGRRLPLETVLAASTDFAPLHWCRHAAKVAVADDELRACDAVREFLTTLPVSAETEDQLERDDQLERAAYALAGLAAAGCSGEKLISVARGCPDADRVNLVEHSVRVSRSMTVGLAELCVAFLPNTATASPRAVEADAVDVLLASNAGDHWAARLLRTGLPEDSSVAILQRAVQSVGTVAVSWYFRARHHPVDLDLESLVELLVTGLDVDRREGFATDAGCLADPLAMLLELPGIDKLDSTVFVSLLAWGTDETIGAYLWGHCARTPDPDEVRALQVALDAGCNGALNILFATLAHQEEDGRLASIADRPELVALFGMELTRALTASDVQRRVRSAAATVAACLLNGLPPVAYRHAVELMDEGVPFTEAIRVQQALLG